VLQALKAQDALPPTLVLTNSDDDRLLFEALRSGAKGFLLKDVSFEQLTQAIETLSSGGNLIQPALTERAVRSLSESGGAFAATD
jgi:DNA-binding NarL/FixJ family response regulator